MRAPTVTEPFVLDDGHLSVPTGPGTGASVLPDTLRRFTVTLRDLYSHP